MAGALFGSRYELQEQLGSGGMARVHRARDTRLGRVVAVKTLHRELARDAEARHRFLREARAAASLNHPGIVTVHDQDEVRDGDDIVPYLVMEYIDGSTLERLVKAEAPLDPVRAVQITCDVLDALAHAHSRGTVHRDVKPSNVMITKSGAVKVADFGIARVVDATTLTVTGFAVGTPGYMSPEQVLGRTVDARSDVYAAGCMLTQLLTASVPFTGESALNIMYGHVHEAPPKPSRRNPEVPGELDEVVLAALAKNPDDRPQDAASMRDVLREWLHTRVDAPPRPLVQAAPAAVPAPAAEPVPSAAPAPEPAPSAAAAEPSAPATGGTPGPDPAPEAGDFLLAGPQPRDAPPRTAPPADALPPARSGDAAPAAPADDDPRTGFTFIKGGGPAAASAFPQPAEPQLADHQPADHQPAPPQLRPSPPSPHQPAPPVQGFGPSQPAPYPVPQPSPGPYQSGPWTAPPPAPPPAFPPATPPAAPAPGGRGRGRNWLLAGTAVAVAGTLVATAVLLDPFGEEGRRKTDPTTSPTPKPTSLVDTRPVASGFDGALNGAVNPSGKKGGTLRLAAPYAPDSLDPAASYTTMAWNLQRVFLRKLVDYAPQPGKAGTKLVPDLATSTGTVSDDGKTYEFTLKGGLRFEDGREITSHDIKYGIERSFARDVYNTGPSHLVDALDQGQKYPGPYKDKSRTGLRSILTPSDDRIVFKLEKPNPDFLFFLSMPAASPVPKEADTKDKYHEKPVASGPYKLAEEYRGDSLTLVRNDQWASGTDTIRTALPDRIELEVHGTQEQVDRALLDGEADLDASQLGLADAARARVMADSDLKSRADAAFTGSVRYLSLQQTVAPFDNRSCRRAVHAAVDKKAIQTIHGGATAGGEVATGMIPPNMPGYDSTLDPFGTKTGANPDAARQNLDACGKKKGFTTKIVAADIARNRQVLEALEASLKEVGIKADTELIELGKFYEQIRNRDTVRKNKWGIILTGWASDWPTPSGLLSPLVRKDADYNYSGLYAWDIEADMDEAAREQDEEAAERKWQEVDEALMYESVLVPLIHDRQVNLRGTRLTNAYIHSSLGGIDIQALGVS
ncbi:hypothetical protein GCM10027168_40530 [Streptomyces capparidis]